jgi:hypothetical protein
MKLTVREKPMNRSTFRLIQQLADRYAAVIESLPSEAAKYLMEEVKSEAPDRLVPGYPRLLKVFTYDIQGIQHAAGVVAPGYAHSVRLRGVDVTTTVLEVKAKRHKNQPPDPAALLLEDHNPWTMATLPYEPDRLEASIRARRFAQREVVAIEAKRVSERRAGLDNKLIALGKRLERADPKLLTRRVTFDIAHAVLRAEFGLGEVKKSHWRPAVRKLRSSGFRGVIKKMRPWFTKPGDSRWSRGVQVDEGQKRDVKRVQGFQDRVAVR